MRYLWACGLFVCVGCQETSLTIYDVDPAVTIISPVENQSFAPEELIEMVGTVHDDGPLEELVVTWSSDLDGWLGESLPDADGTVYLAIGDLSDGDHAITLQAVDGSGNSGTAAIGIVVQEDDETLPVDGFPLLEILGPTAGEEFLIETEVFFIGTVTDLEQAWDSLLCSWTSSRDGQFWEGNPLEDGTLQTSTTQLAVGEHTITLRCEDEDGHVTAESVTMEILNDGRPYVTITAPETHSEFWMDETIMFEGSVTDDETDNELLTVEWRSDIDGIFATGVPSSVGFTGIGVILTVGAHVVTLSALDADNQLASDSIVVQVNDPGDYDLDGDDFTPNEGDCDDDDASLNPDEDEWCDDEDNDCDGDVNEPWADIYEWDSNNEWLPNDDGTTASDLDDLDHFLWGTNTLEMTGLTFHHEEDEDWYYWDANDNLIDNAHIHVYMQTPADGNYTIVLYLAGSSESNVADFSSYTPKDSATGNGLLHLEAHGSIISEDDDYWVIRVYPSSWPDDSCGDTYGLQINS